MPIMTPWSSEETKPKPATSDQPQDAQSFKMKHARHPMGGNIDNSLLAQKREEEATQKLDTPERSKESLQSQTVQGYQPAVDAEKTQALRSKLGQAADEIIGLAESFTKEGTDRVEGLVQGGVNYNEQTGKWEASLDSNQSPTFKSMAEEKYQELQRLRQRANTFFVKNEGTGQWEPREFKDVVVEHYNTLTPDTRMQVDSEVQKLMSIATKLNRLGQLGESESSEAYSLRRQLELEDKQGLVSGLYRAMQEAEKVMNGEDIFFGDEGGEGYSFSDILNLSQDQIEEELQKAVESASGLFGGDYEAAIERAIDRESEEYVKSQREDVEFRNTMMEQGRGYFKRIQSQLLGAAKEIKQAFDNVAPNIISAMGDDVDAQVAREWLGNLMSATPQGFASTIAEALYDPSSGLQVQERALIAQYIGDILKSQGIDLGIDSEDAKLTDAINEITRTGQVSWTDSRGVTQVIKPTAIQKARLLLAADQGPDVLKKEFENILSNKGIDLQKVVNDVTDDGSYSSLQRATTGFQGAVIDSLETFKGSGTEQALAQKVMETYSIDGAAWNAMSEAQQSELLLRGLKENSQLTTDIIKEAADRQKQQFETQKGILEGQLGTLQDSYDMNILKLGQRLIDYQSQYTQKMTEVLSQVASNQGASLNNKNDYVSQLSSSPFVVGLMANGMIDNEVINRVAETLSRVDFLKSVEQTPGATSIHDAYMKQIPNDVEGRYIKNLLEELGMGAQPSGREALSRELLTNPDKRRALSTILTRVTSVPPETLIMMDSDVQRYQAQYDRLQNQVKEGIGTLENAKAGIPERLRTLDALSKSFDKAVYDPSMVLAAAQKIGRDLEEQGYTGDAFFDLEGTGQRDRMVEASDLTPEQQQFVDVRDKMDTLENVGGAIQMKPVSMGGASTGLETQTNFDPVAVAVEHGADVDRIVGTAGKSKILISDPGDPSQSVVTDEGGNILGQLWVDPMTGQTNIQYTDGRSEAVSGRQFQKEYSSSWDLDVQEMTGQPLQGDFEARKERYRNAVARGEDPVEQETVYQSALNDFDRNAAEEGIDSTTIPEDIKFAASHTMGDDGTGDYISAGEAADIIQNARNVVDADGNSTYADYRELLEYTDPDMTEVEKIAESLKVTAQEKAKQLQEQQEKQETMNTFSGYSRQEQDMMDRYGGYSRQEQDMMDRYGGYSRQEQDMTDRYGGYSRQEQDMTDRYGGGYDSGGHRTKEYLFMLQGDGL